MQSLIKGWQRIVILILSIPLQTFSKQLIGLRMQWSCLDSIILTLFMVWHKLQDLRLIHLQITSVILCTIICINWGITSITIPHSQFSRDIFVLYLGWRIILNHASVGYVIRPKWYGIHSWFRFLYQIPSNSFEGTRHTICSLGIIMLP